MLATTTLLLPILTLLSLPFTSSLPTVTRTGKYLYSTPTNSSTPTRFYIKGIAYQPQGSISASSDSNTANGGFLEPSDFIDPLSSGTNCTRDLPYLKELGVNAVRVYSVDPEVDHGDCMKLFEDAGIYVILDVSLPLNGSINRASPTWSTTLLTSYITTITTFLPYTNVLAFNIGNEVVNLATNTDAAPFVKAAARDVKAFLRSEGSAALVGYSSVDGEEDFRTPLATYLTCGNDTVDIDLFGLNNYEWCGSSTYQSSGWETITSDFSQVQVATYMSEYGCITNPPRLWQEVPSLFSQPVSDVFSGGVAFSYFPTVEGYGLATFSGSDGQTVTTGSDYALLLAQYSNITTGPNTPAQASVTAMEGTCPTTFNSTFQANVTLPPTPDAAVCDCVYTNSFSCIATANAAGNPTILGELIDYGCSLLGSSGQAASCAAIAGNGSTGVYGSLSYCSLVIKASYVFSAWYEENGRNAQACDFGGNATTIDQPPNTASDASAAAASCLASAPADGVYTVTGTDVSPSTSTASATGSSTSSGATATTGTTQSGAAVRLSGSDGWTIQFGVMVAAVGVALGSGALLL